MKILKTHKLTAIIISSFLLSIFFISCSNSDDCTPVSNLDPCEDIMSNIEFIEVF